jgi:hypothetical protein
MSQLSTVSLKHREVATQGAHCYTHAVPTSWWANGTRKTRSALSYTLHTHTHGHLSVPTRQYHPTGVLKLHTNLPLLPAWDTLHLPPSYSLGTPLQHGGEFTRQGAG